MQAIEFEAQLNNGIISLPKSYNHWQMGKKVKVIILGDDEAVADLPQDDKVALSCLDLIQDDIAIIEDAPSDLSTNPVYLEGYGK